MLLNLFFPSRLRGLATRGLQVVALIGFFSTVSAQGIVSYDTYVLGLDNTSREHLESLTGDVQPTVFINNGSMTAGGEGSPKVLDFSVNEFASVEWNSPLLSQVELVRIRVNQAGDLNTTLNLAASAVMSQLRYVLVLTGIEATPAQLSNLTAGTGQNIQTLYSISIPN